MTPKTRNVVSLPGPRLRKFFDNDAVGSQCFLSEPRKTHAVAQGDRELPHPVIRTKPEVGDGRIAAPREPIPRHRGRSCNKRGPQDEERGADEEAPERNRVEVIGELPAGPIRAEEGRQVTSVVDSLGTIRDKEETSEQIAIVSRVLNDNGREHLAIVPFPS